ncbi:hypothetical protein [Microbacterium sp. E-13]|uniref:hypothetical protein n=1 Tax=Microbacterium sp. E-13 TaxID=3404048 RepID=UPI003CFA65F2
MTPTADSLVGRPWLEATESWDGALIAINVSDVDPSSQPVENPIDWIVMAACEIEDPRDRTAVVAVLRIDEQNSMSKGEARERIASRCD